MQSSIENQLHAIRAGLDLKPDEIDVSNLLPIFVPSSFFQYGNWPGPYTRLRAPEIGLTWSVLLPGQAMRYMDRAMQELWEQNGLDWKEIALRNLSKLTNDQPGGIRQLQAPSGDVMSLAFMFQDGYGPSRLLFRERLAQIFPAGYRVAMPEMSCGFAFAKDLEGEGLATVNNVIETCYRQGTRRLAPGSFDPDDLLPLEG